MADFLYTNRSDIQMAMLMFWDETQFDYELTIKLKSERTE